MSQNQDTIIKVDGLSKEYFLGSNLNGDLRSKFSSIFKKKEKTVPFQALNNISFHVNQGEILGIIGKNGAGKSTLLKILSRITSPSAGRMEITGRVASLLEVGTGFHPELTGRENIFLNGTILGMTRKEVASKLEDIIAFSGITDFIDTPVKRYSSGMYVRLAFAVAAHLEPEILIIDEVLAVGDYEFQQKCLGKMEDVAKSGRTVLFVSHNLAAVKNLCTRAIVLQKGELVFNGSVNDAISYYQDNSKELKKTFDLTMEKFSRKDSMCDLIFESIEYKSQPFKFGENIFFKLSVRKTLDRTFTNLVIATNIYDLNGNCLMHVSNKYLQKSMSQHENICSYTFKIDSVLRPGIYIQQLFIRDSVGIQDWIVEGIQFEIEDGNPYEYNNTSELQGVILPKFSVDKN